MNSLQMAWNHWRHWCRRITIRLVPAYAHPERRLAMRKRELQRVCMQVGVSRAKAVQIASTYFRKNSFTSSSDEAK